MFNEMSHGKKFNFNSDNLPFIKLSEVPVGKVYEVKEVFINRKGKFGPTATVTTEDARINVPNHIMKDIEIILGSQEMIDAINEGHCGFKRIENYTDRNGTSRVSGTFVDL